VRRFGNIKIFRGFSERDRFDRGQAMGVSFELPQDIESELRSNGVDLDREATEVYFREQYRQAKISHRQLQAALGLSVHETEQLVKQRGLGQDLDDEAFGARRDLLGKARPQ
jgi:hypothetical protein